jgi:Asp/Glu/Hydantoin racemase.
MLIKSGYPFYGQHIGILVFSGLAPRIPGDAGHSSTFPFPVRYAVVKGGFMDLVSGEPSVRDSLIEAVETLKQEGISAVAGDCGLMSLYQRELASVGLPVAASSLCQIPMIWQLIGKQGKIGIITGHSEMLRPVHLEESGCGGIPLAVQGMEDEPHFSKIVINGGTELDPALMEKDVLNAAEKLIKNNPEVKAIVLECTNLATYSRAVNELTGLPVFDIVSAVKMLEYAVNPQVFGDRI